MKVEALKPTPKFLSLLPGSEALPKPKGHILKIQGLKQGEIAYNPARPLTVTHPRSERQATLLPVRVESAASNINDPDGIYDPRIDFVERVGNNGTWRIIDHEHWNLTRTLDKLNGLEDPAVATIDGEIVLSGVRATFCKDGNIKVVTEVYAGKNLQDLEHITQLEGKDNRFCALPDGRVLLAIRPQGGEAGLGRIGFALISDIRNFDQSSFYGIPILVGQVPEDHWVGANEMQVTNVNGQVEVGVLGHIATKDNDGIRHYAPMAFTVLNVNSLDTQAPVTTPIKTLVRASDLPQTGAKAPDLTNVAYPGALVRKGNGRADLYLGKNDWHAAVLPITDPFKRR